MRPRREQRDPLGGDAEGSIRAILTRLLEASGSQTPALASAARRRPSAGLGTLVEELEAALIPVNRAAGRRALARLAREVKRVTLGVGRNASLAPGEPAPRRASSPSHSATRDGTPRHAPQEESRPIVSRSGFTDEPPTTSRHQVLADPLPPAGRSAEPLPAGAPDAPVSHSTSPDPSELPTIEVRKEHVAAALDAGPSSKVEVNPGSGRGAPHAADEVDHLLASFGVSARGEQSQRNELKALVGLEPTPPPPGSEHAYERAQDGARRGAHDSDVESLLANSDSGPPVAAKAGSKADANPGSSSNPRGLASPPTAISPTLAKEPYGAGRAQPNAMPGAALNAPATPPRGRGESVSHPDRAERPPSGPGAVPTAPSARRLAEMASRPNIAPPPDRSLTVFAVVILALGGGAIWILRPAIFGAHEVTPTPSAVAPAPSASASVAASRCRASLILTGAPANAEILLRAGQAPVDVEKMPVGPRLEFVATAEGYAPKRAIIPAGAPWDSGSDGKPRYEVAVQLDRSRARPGTVDSWPAGEPGSDVGGKGLPGTVHLVTTPRGAEVWQLAALGPDAQFDVKCGGEVEVLVAGPTTLRKRLRIAESEFIQVDGGADRQATVSAK